MKKTLLTSLLTLVVAATTYAGPMKASKEVVVIEPTSLFRDNELQIDAFGTGAFYQAGRPGWGGGLGATYFFLRYIGVGVDQSIFGREQAGSAGYAEWATLGHVYLRYPIDSINLAPYIMAGGGALYGTGKGHGVGDVGGGLEYRFTQNIGMFTDCKWVFTNDSNHSGALARTGLRFAF